MRSCRALLAALGAAVLSAALVSPCPGETIRVPLAYRTIPVNPKLHEGLGCRHACLAVERIGADYEGLIIPEGASSRAIYGLLTYAGRKHIFMADTDTPDAPFLNYMVYDANHNMDLNDDPPLATYTAQRPNKYKMMRAPVELDLAVAGQDKWSFVLESTGWGFDDERSAKRTPHIELFFASALHGEVSIGQRSLSFQLMDTNANGRFGDRMVRGAGCDDFLVSRAGGESPAVDRKYATRFTPSLLVVGDRSFHVDADPKGTSCSLTELVDGALLRVPGNVFCGWMTGPGGDTLLLEPSRDVLLPEGRYAPVRFYLEKCDTNGAPWMVKTSKPQAETLTLTASGETEFKIGEPFSVSATASRRDDTHRLCIWFRDANGRALDSDFITFGIPKPPTPTARILDKDGIIVETMRLGYG